jgi:protein BCP1
VGLVLSERLINVPTEIVPPLYTMLQEEIQWAVDEGEPYKFTHYLVLSKTYTEVASTLDVVQDDRPQKKKKAKSHGEGGSSETFYFHPEDEVLARYATAVGSYPYTKEEGTADSKRAFQELGIKPQGHMILIEAGKFSEAITAVEGFLKAP